MINTVDQNHNVAETQGYIKILNDMIKDWLDLEYVLRILNKMDKIFWLQKIEMKKLNL